jgi:hypothetical protein
MQRPNTGPQIPKCESGSKKGKVTAMPAMPAMPETIPSATKATIHRQSEPTVRSGGSLAAIDNASPASGGKRTLKGTSLKDGIVCEFSGFLQNDLSFID